MENILELAIERKNGIIVRVKCEAMKELFTSASPTISSRTWNKEDGTSAVAFSSESASAGFLRQFFGYDNYGSALIQEGKLNAAILRTQGIENGVALKINEIYPNEIIEEALEDFKQRFQKYVVAVWRPKKWKLTIEGGD